MSQIQDKFGKRCVMVYLTGSYARGDATDYSDIYRRCLADVIMIIRHYICVDKPKEKLTHDRMKTYVLKPLMFALRQERFCKTGIYPLSINDLLASYSDGNKILMSWTVVNKKDTIFKYNFIGTNSYAS